MLELGFLFTRIVERYNSMRYNKNSIVATNKEMNGMNRVILVDDEPRILRGIQRSIPWQKFGFEVIGAYDNPIEALHAIIEQTPEVVFTDIRMPGIMGIELIQKVREASVNVEFVVSSGYAEFEYARAVMRSGVFDYILKPLNRSGLEELLTRLSEHLRRKQKTSNGEMFFDYWMDNTLTLGSFLARTGIQTKLSNIGLALLIGEELQPSRLSSVPMLTTFELGYGRTVYLFESDVPESADVRLLFEGAGLSSDCSVGIVITDNRDRSLYRLYEEADIASKGRFIDQEHNVFQYRKNDAECLSLVQRLSAYLVSHNDEAFQSDLKDMPRLFRASDFGIDNCVFVWNALLPLLKHRDQMGLEAMDPYLLMETYTGIDQMCETLAGAVSPHEESITTGNENFMQLLGEVNARFTEELSLRQLASKFYVGFAYSCVLFKKTTGMTFSEYVKTLRMKRAAELLAEPGTNVKNICSAVGFNDYFYFNKVFKKHFGISASQYKKQRSY